MDTKWKKIKSFTGLLCYIMGLTLLLGGISAGVSGYLNRDYTLEGLNELADSDYQNTRRFRRYIANWLSTAVDMAAGKPMDIYYWNGYDYSFSNYYGADEVWEQEKEAVWEQELEAVWEQELEAVRGTAWPALEDVGEASGNFQNEDYAYPEEWQRRTPEENQKIIEREHARMEPNKNILYTISYEGKLLYSNTAGLALGDGSLPEGYNFLLHFDGSKVTIVKDGQELDVYGDGYYRKDSDWYVPGYENFTTGEELQKAEIYMAVTQEPKRYIYSQSNRPGFRQAEDELYWIRGNFADARAALARNIFCLVAGILLLIPAHCCKKSRKEWEQLIARCLGHIWLEAKIVLGLLMLLLFSSAGIHGGVYSRVVEDITILSWETSYYPQAAPYIITEILQEIFRMILAEPMALLTLFWLIYLAVLDVRQNKAKIAKQSLTAKIVQLFSTKEIALPFGKKLVHRCIPGLVCTLLLCAAATMAAVLAENLTLFLVLAALAIAVIGIQCFHISGMRKLACDMDLLTQRIAVIHRGQYEGGGEAPASPDLAAAFLELEDIRQGMSEAIDEQMKSQRMKVELIANVSHDIKTPLTSIISYVEFLKQEEGLPEHVKDYIRILDEKSQRLKNMIQDVFAVSKAAAGQLSVNMERLDFGKLLRQTMADMEEEIHGSSVTVKTEIPEAPIFIEGDGQRLYRVFQNLIQNALKYSLEGSRVYITLKEDGNLAVASVKNTSRFEIDQNKDFTERFVRGDESRTDGGSGLGLSIARNFTEACGGTFRLETIADLFTVTVSFRRAATTDES